MSLWLTNYTREPDYLLSLLAGHAVERVVAVVCQPVKHKIHHSGQGEGVRQPLRLQHSLQQKKHCVYLYNNSEIIRHDQDRHTHSLLKNIRIVLSKNGSLPNGNTKCKMNKTYL